ncbi:MAG: GNAT family N-acetyltransferase [Thalassobaculales bacterium]
MSITLTRADGYVLSTDRARLDRPAIHRYLAEESYWAKGMDRARLDRAIEHSLCYGVYAPDGSQVGFGRVITDYATAAYLTDIYVIEAVQGLGLGKWMVEAMLAHPDLQGLRRWMLGTRDAHGLYAKFGFVDKPEGRAMVRPG